MPGVEIHAQVLERRADRRGPVRSRASPGDSNSWAPWCLASSSLRLRRISGRPSWFAFGALFASLLMGTSWYFYVHNRLLIDFTYPLLSTTAIYLTLIFSSFVREQAQRRQIRSAFGPVPLARAWSSSSRSRRKKLVLGGEEARHDHHVLGMFVASPPFRRTYKHDPQGLTKLMNRFLTPLTNAILARKGTIDKYMGDAIMAFWKRADRRPGTSTQRLRSRGRHAGGASWTSTSSARVEAQNGGHVYIPLNVGVGLNTGVCVVGNMGFRPALRLFGAGRQRQSGVAPGRAEQGIRLPDHRRLQDGACGQGPVCDPRTRLHHGERQDRARGDLRDRRPARIPPQSAQFQKLRKPDHRDAGVLSHPRLGTARWPRSSGGPQRPTRRIRWRCSTTSMRRESSTTRKKPAAGRLGAAPTRC